MSVFWAGEELVSVFVFRQPQELFSLEQKDIGITWGFILYSIGVAVGYYHLYTHQWWNAPLRPLEYGGLILLFLCFISRKLYFEGYVNSALFLLVCIAMIPVYYWTSGRLTTQER